MIDKAQFRASRTIRHRGSRSTSGWMIDDEDEPVDIQARVQDDVQMVAKIDVPHPIEREVFHTSKMTEVSHPSKAEYYRDYSRDICH